MLSILGTIVVGLIVGLIARALKPGNDSMGFIMTILLGIAGAFAANTRASPPVFTRKAMPWAGSPPLSAPSCCC